MKSAEEWRVSVSGLRSTAGYYTDDEVKAIQLDSWKQGMTDAAEICHNDPHDSTNQELRDRISFARDERQII